MKKKEYIDAINEIEVDKDLKNKTLEKITKKKNYRKVYSVLATSIIIFVIAISITLPMADNKNKVTPIDIVEENEGLPKVGNFEKLCDILKNAKSVNDSYNKGVISDAIMDSVDISMSEGLVTENATTEYSGTNVQVEGVDEADIVKTDGKYIYYVSDNKIVIVNAADSSNLKIMSEVQFNAREIYIYDNKLIALGRKNNNNYNRLIEVDSMSYNSYINNPTIVANVYDITNKAKPKLEREVEVEGDYLSSRMIGENLYFITNRYLYSYLLRNKDINEIDENAFKPIYKDTAVSNQEQYIDYNEIYYFPESEDTSYLTVAGFNVTNNEKANISTYLGAGTEIYSSENNLYITRTEYEYKDSKYHGYYNNYDLNTYIYKFELKDSNATYLKAGSVPGKVLNQFSMDEKDRYFRIATTDSQSWNSEIDTNNLYVLDQDLEIVGKVEGLAKGEKIYSVRFMGNRVYMVTFVETDPLFVIDVSNPEEPMVLGELKIPGYSKYLHPYDENHIIGFGENTRINEYGGVVADGMKMALFDVSNPKNPKELHSVDIGDRGTYSEILDNHKALLFSKEKNIIAFPIRISEEIGEYTTKSKFQGAIVYGLDLENGFNVKGKIAHDETEDGYIYYDYTKVVERIIYINDSLYTLSQGMIKSTNMNTMEEEDVLEL